MTAPLTVAVAFWDATDASFGFSRGYSALWVERLYRGFLRSLNGIPFEFICYSERERVYSEPAIIQRRIAGEPGYASIIQTFAASSGPLILVGLDTVITGDLSPLVDWVTSWHDCIALPRDPYGSNPRQACNGIVLVPAGMGPGIAYRHAAEGGTINDMVWCREQPHVLLDDILAPDLVQSYKGSVKDLGLGDARIVYFHGLEKPGEINEPWIAEHWR